MKNQFGGDRNVPFVTGSNGQPVTVLDYYSLTGINPWVWLVLELCFPIVFFGLAFLALTYVRHVRR